MASPPKHPSPLRESTLWEGAHSPNLPQRDSILAESTKGWSPLRLSKRTTPDTSMSRSSSDENSFASGGESPRRTSSSFKQLSRGLVSNSVFKQPTSPTVLRDSPVVPRVSRVANPVLPSPQGLGISTKKPPKQRSAPRDSDSFTQLGDKSLVSSSPFSGEPASPSVLTSPKRMVGPRTFDSMTDLASVALAETPSHSSEASSSGYTSSSTRSRSKTVTFSEEQEVREFERAEYEARDSLGSEASGQTEETEEDDADSDDGGTVEHNLINTPSAQEMVEQFLREEELEEQARLLSLAVQQVDSLRTSPSSLFDDSGADDSPVVGRPYSPTKSALPHHTLDERPSTPTSNRPLPHVPSYESIHDPEGDEDEADRTIIENSMNESMTVDDSMAQDDSTVIEESTAQDHSMTFERAQGAEADEQPSPLPYWEESALDRMLDDEAGQTKAPASRPDIAPVPSLPVAPARTNSFRNGRPKITREGVQERLRLKQLNAAHETSPPTASAQFEPRSAERTQPVDPIKDFLSSSSSFTDDQLCSPLEKLGAERYSSPSLSSSFVGMIREDEEMHDSPTPQSAPEHHEALAPAFPHSPNALNPTPKLSYLSTPVPETRSPASPDLAERERALLAARRRSRSLRDGDAPDYESLTVPERPLVRRRSLSTGDMSPVIRPPRTGSYVSSDDSKLSFFPSSPALDFAASVDAQVSSRFPRAPGYLTVERRVIADDGSSTPAGNTVVTKPKGWRAIRKASDMNQRAEEIRQLKKETTRTDPGIYIKLADIEFDKNLQMPLRPSMYWRVIHTQHETADSEDLMLVRPGLAELFDEWVLPPGSKYIYIKLRLRLDERLDSHLLRTSSMSQASLAESSISHKNSTGGLRKLFSSPKKNRAVAPRPPPPDPIRQYMDDRGIFAEGIIPYFELAHKCHGRIICHYMNLKSPQNKQQVAKLQFKMFFLPSLPGSPKLPENIKSVECGLQTLKTNNTLAYKGELSQLGGDCKSWRRRTFEIKGDQLMASNEVTKQVHAVFDLRLASRLTDLHSPVDTSGSAARDRRHFDDESFDVKHSFKLVFVDGGEVSFYADDEAKKRHWLQVLQQVLDANAARQQTSNSKELTPPLWAVALQQQLAAQPAQPVVPQKPAAQKPAAQKPAPQKPATQMPMAMARPSMAAIAENGESSASLPDTARVGRSALADKPAVPKKDSSVAVQHYSAIQARPQSYAGPSAPTSSASSNRFSVQINAPALRQPPPSDSKTSLVTSASQPQVTPQARDSSKPNQLQRRRP